MAPRTGPECCFQELSYILIPTFRSLAQKTWLKVLFRRQCTQLGTHVYSQGAKSKCHSSTTSTIMHSYNRVLDNGGNITDRLLFSIKFPTIWFCLEAVNGIQNRPQDLHVVLVQSNCIAACCICVLNMTDTKSFVKDVLIPKSNKNYIGQSCWSHPF